MRLIHALHKSEHRAAILALPTHLWSEVIVEWAPHQYTTEIHQYKQDGNLHFQIINYERVNETQLRLQLGNEYYFSSEWMPYATPTPQQIGKQIKTIRSKMRPRPRKESRDLEWQSIMREVYG